VNEAELAGPFASLLVRARQMPLEETRALLISTGILTPDGKLAPHYQSHGPAVKKLLESKNGRPKTNSA
jgi:hypothetical protein